MKHMRIIVTHYGGPEALQVIEEECPQPKDGEVRVKVLAAGVALPDVMAREGIHPETPRVPFTPGWDLVGVVHRLGAGVSGIEPSQTVAAMPINGAYASPKMALRYWIRIAGSALVGLGLLCLPSAGRSPTIYGSGVAILSDTGSLVWLAAILLITGAIIFFASFVVTVARNNIRRSNQTPDQRRCLATLTFSFSLIDARRFVS